ncbi:hypothetical protein [Nonomuraea sp. NPDC050310]|uniref:hypothetical protein n=1 Tax=Nonomuraea sp. NPDC050310 TaxID=3154935 RepID=UPI0033D871F4
MRVPFIGVSALALAAALLTPGAASAAVNPDDPTTLGSGGCYSVSVTRQDRVAVAYINLNGCKPKHAIRAVMMCIHVSIPQKYYGPWKRNAGEFSATNCPTGSKVARYGYQYGSGSGPIHWN